MRTLYRNRLGIELPLLFSMMILNHFPRKKIPLKYCTLFFVVAWLLLFAFILTGCKAQNSENTTPFKVMDSGMWVWDAGEGGQSWWLDNERVLFPSNEKLEPGGGPKKMMIWNPSTGQVMPSQLSRVTCVREGQIIFGERDPLTKKVMYYRGPLDNLQEHPASSPDTERIDPFFDCDWVPKATYGNVSYKRKLRGENYLEYVEGGPDESGTPRRYLKGGRSASESSQRKIGPLRNRVVYYERPGSKGVEMPFQIGGWNGYDVKYIEWRKAYLVKPDQYYVDKPIRLWWIEANGKVYEEPLPEKFPFPFAGGIDFFPVKTGILVRYSGGHFSGHAGGYLIHDGKIDRIIKRTIHYAAVSPNGCRAVFVHTTNKDGYFARTKPYRTLKLIDFCEGRRMFWGHHT